MKLTVNVGLKAKIMGMVMVPMVLLAAVFLVVYQRSQSIAEEQRDKERAVAHRIAFDATMLKQQQRLERQVLNILNTDEVAQFLKKRDDNEARMVVEGLYLSLKEEKIVRYSLYDAGYRLVAEYSNNLPARPSQLTQSLQPVFRQSAEDYLVHYYFRGTEQGMAPVPTELCGMTMVSGDNDQPLGYIELAIDPMLWLKEIADLTGNVPVLYDTAKKELSLATEKGVMERLASKVAAGGVPEFVVGRNRLLEVKDGYWAVNGLALNGGNDQQVGLLLLIADVTALMRAERQRNLLAAGVCLLIVVLSQLAAFIVVKRGIVDPVCQVGFFAEKMASGNMADTLPVTTGGECGAMTEALNAMIARVQLRSRQVEAIAEGDLTEQISTASENDVLGKALLRITSRLGVVIRNIQTHAVALDETSNTVLGLADNLQDTTGGIGTLTSELNASFSTVTSNLEMVAGAIEQMSASVREISQSTAENSQVARRTAEFSETTTKILAELSGAVASISAANQSITDFADQTNLLALNATIEAARAGEAGRGFAVVASEVKDLANQSMRTAKEVNEDIHRIELLTGKAVEAARNITDAIGIGKKSSDIIATTVEEQAAVASDIAQNVATAFQLTTGFTVRLDEISKAVDGNVAAAQSMNDFSQQLAELAGQLKESTGMFRLADS